MRNLISNKEKYLELFGLLIKFVTLKSKKKEFEVFITSNNLMKVLENLFSFNYINQKELQNVLHNFRRDFMEKEENKNLRLEGRKLNKFYTKFFNEFIFPTSTNPNFNSSKQKNIMDINDSLNKLIDNNYNNIPDFVFEKIKQFLKVCLFATVDVYKNNGKSPIFTIEVKKNNGFLQKKTSEEKMNISDLNSNEDLSIVHMETEINNNGNNNIPDQQEILRENVLESIFKSIKSMNSNDYLYLEYTSKIQELNDIFILHLYMCIFEIFSEKIYANSKFFDQITMTNW